MDQAKRMGSGHNVGRLIYWDTVHDWRGSAQPGPSAAAPFPLPLGTVRARSKDKGIGSLGMGFQPPLFINEFRHRAEK